MDDHVIPNTLDNFPSKEGYEFSSILRDGASLLTPALPFSRFYLSC
jgi:hypothetical protein